MSRPNITIRPATRADLPDIARLHAAAFMTFEIYGWIMPDRAVYPEEFYRYLLLRDKLLFAEPHIRFLIAEAPKADVKDAVAARAGKGKGKDRMPQSDLEAVRDTASRRRDGADRQAQSQASANPQQQEMVPLAFACYEALGETPLSIRWRSDPSFPSTTAYLDRFLLPLERSYVRYFLNHVADYSAFTTLRARFAASFADVPGEKLLHLQFLITGPEYEGLGAGGRLLGWGQELATKEGLCLGLESSYAANKFYERRGFRKVKQLVIEEWKEGYNRDTTTTPIMLWEPEGMEGVVDGWYGAR